MDSTGGRIVHTVVNMCLYPVLFADGCYVTTIEGVGSWCAKYAGLNCNDDASNSASNNANITNGKERKEGHLHLIHRAMVNFHGSQCGFCTPGIIMALYSLFSTEESTNMSCLVEYLDGNLCRYTGYRPIWDATRSLCGNDIEITNAVKDWGTCVPYALPGVSGARIVRDGLQRRQ